MKTIGITGGVGAGKSTVLDFLRETYQASVCEADKVAHELQRPGEGCYQEILKVFGPEILCDDQTIDRKRLGSIVFADVEKLKRLNGIVHPKVKEWIRKKQEEEQRAGTKLFIIEAALLLEDHYEIGRAHV